MSQVAEERAVRADCVPFSSVPHTSRLYLDYLSRSQKISQFYPRSADSRWAVDEARALKFDDARRETVADLLRRQNESCNASSETLRNIERLRNGAVAAVSGQQVGLFGGPLFSVLKAASAIRLARDLTAKGVDAVPVFWLATEDHDLAEVSSALFTAGGGTRRFSSTSEGKKAAPVGHVEFGSEIDAVVSEACEMLGAGEVADALRESYRPGENFGSAFAKLFARLFGAHGLILLDPIDAAWHEIAKPLLRAAIERAGELNDALLARGKQLHAAGYHEQVKVTAESTLLFAFEDGERTVIHRANSGFSIGRGHYSADELLERVDRHPEQFSPNVLLRPLMQDYLLPTVAYFGGAAEVAYFAQAAVVYEKLLGRVTPILPRLSGTLIDGRQERLLKRYALSMPELFHSGDQLAEMLATRVLPGELQRQLRDAEQSLTASLSAIRGSLTKLDATLIDALNRSERKMQYQLGKIASKSARAELRRNQQIASDAHEIAAGLLPEKNLQEREVAGIYFLSKYGLSLIDDLVEAAGIECPGHQVMYV